MSVPSSRSWPQSIRAGWSLLLSPHHPGKGLYHTVGLLLSLIPDTYHWLTDVSQHRHIHVTLLKHWLLRQWQLLLSSCRFSDRDKCWRVLQDKRFNHPVWHQTKILWWLQQSYLLTSRYLKQWLRMTAQNHPSAQLLVHLGISACSPDNIWPCNPKIVDRWLKTRGRHIQQSMAYLFDDLTTWRGYINFCKERRAAPRRATQDRNIIHRNQVMTLYRYGHLANTPMLLVPSWLNRSYLFDLTPQQSLIAWLIQRGFSIYLIDWHEPRKTDRWTVDTYVVEGIIEALAQAKQDSGHEQIHTMGHCLGGTLLCVALSLWLRQQRTPEVISLSLFATLLDFKQTGLMAGLMSKWPQRFYQHLANQQGYWDKRQIAMAFNLLSPEDLIWSYWNKRYGQGLAIRSLPILTWASDVMHATVAMHRFYSQTLYRDNQLTQGELVVSGQRVLLQRLQIPTYLLAMEDDHITPWPSVLASEHHLPQVHHQVLTTGGHYTGLLKPTSRRSASSQSPMPNHLQKIPHWWEHWCQWLQDHEQNTVTDHITQQGLDETIACATV